MKTFLLLISTLFFFFALLSSGNNQTRDFVCAFGFGTWALIRELEEKL